VNEPKKPRRLTGEEQIERARAHRKLKGCVRRHNSVTQKLDVLYARIARAEKNGTPEETLKELKADAAKLENRAGLEANSMLILKEVFL
jgi:hypothetical protein